VVDLSDGEKKLHKTDLVIRGRGPAYVFHRTYRGFDYRAALDVQQDFGANWTFSYANEFLMKDGTGADADSNYFYLRDGQAGYAFVNTATDTWSPGPQQFTQLTRLSSGDFEVATATAWCGPSTASVARWVPRAGSRPWRIATATS